MKVSLLSLGCKVNQAECSRMEAAFRERGWSIVGLDEGPDISIVNTCTVTSKSDYQSRQLIRRASGCGSKVVVTGCYSELNSDFVRSMTGVEMVVSNVNKDSIVNMIAGTSSRTFLDFSTLKRSRFHLKVQDGCNNSCSYCAIPSARGRSRSIEIEKIIQHVRLASVSYNEIVLTGIHLGTYGYDLVAKVKLSDLLGEILKRTDIGRIRLSSLEIGEIDDQLLEIMQDPRICNHLHIPLQSGDNRILRDMNRNYDAEKFSSGVLHIHSKVPNVAMGTDVIVGFPGESEVEFQNTLDLIEALPISYLHVFPFSPRPNTKAFGMSQQVPSQGKRDRASLLRALSKRKKDAYMQGQIGQSLEMLVEERGHSNEVTGRTANYLRVRAFHESAMPRSLVSVRITEVMDDILLAHAI